MTKQTLDISLTAAQAEFMALKCPHPLFVGGYNSGKSYLMSLLAVIYAQHHPDALIGVYEPSHELTRLISWPNVKMWLERFGIEYDENKNDHTIMTKNKNIGNFIFKSYQDPEGLVGYQTYAAFVDELDTIPPDKAEFVWERICARNRLQLEGINHQYCIKNIEGNWETFNRTMAFTTPEGHRFCYKKWVQLAKDNPDYQRVHAKTRDNPGASEQYITGLLRSLTPQKAEAYLEGKFVNLTAGTVYCNYNREIHRSCETIQDKETLYIGMDFNVYHMSAKVFVKRNGDQWHLVKEWDGVRDTPAMIELINVYRDKGHKIYVYPDSSGNSKRSANANASASDIAQLVAAGYHKRCRASNPLVKDRVAATNTAFSNGILYVNDLLCSTAADCLEQQVYDKAGKPDKDSGHDHSNDAFSYVLAYEAPVRQKLWVVPFKYVV